MIKKMNLREKLEESRLINAELLLELDETRKVLGKLAKNLEKIIDSGEIPYCQTFPMVLQGERALHDYYKLLMKYPDETI